MPGFVPSYGEGTMGELVLQVLRDAGDGGLTVTELIEACDRAGRKFKNAMAAQSGARSALVGNGNSKSQADSKAVFRCLSKEGRFVDQRWTVRFDKLDLTSLRPTPTGETVMVPKPGRRRKSSAGGSAICEHGRERSKCKECGGSQICEHGRRRYLCKECGGAGICEHGRRRYDCKECASSVR